MVAAKHTFAQKLLDGKARPTLGETSVSCLTAKPKEKYEIGEPRSLTSGWTKPHWTKPHLCPQECKGAIGQAQPGLGTARDFSPRAHRDDYYAVPIGYAALLLCYAPSIRVGIPATENFDHYTVERVTSGDELLGRNQVLLTNRKRFAAQLQEQHFSNIQMVLQHCHCHCHCQCQQRIARLKPWRGNTLVIEDLLYMNACMLDPKHAC